MGYDVVNAGYPAILRNVRKPWYKHIGYFTLAFDRSVWFYVVAAIAIAALTLTVLGLFFNFFKGTGSGGGGSVLVGNSVFSTVAPPDTFRMPFEPNVVFENASQSVQPRLSDVAVQAGSLEILGTSDLLLPSILQSGHRIALAVDGGDVEIRRGGLIASGIVMSLTGCGCPSDARIKNVTAALVPAQCLARVASLRPVDYNFTEAWLEKSSRPRDRAQEYGFIAQEVMRVMPYAVHTVQVGTDETLMVLDKSAIVPELVGAIQALLLRVQTLEKRLVLLERGG